MTPNCNLRTDQFSVITLILSGRCVRFIVLTGGIDEIRAVN